MKNLRIVLSHFQVEPILKARLEGRETLLVSLDLGLTQSEVKLGEEGVFFPDGQFLFWEELEEIAENRTTCFEVADNHLERIQLFSEEMNRFYSLYPTPRAPTLMVSGIVMHRIKGIDPYEDTLRKIQCLAPVLGVVLDTATGLGYTAIEAAKTAERVVTIEIDPLVLEMARRNPWSQALFDNPKIEQIIGDATEEVSKMASEIFSRILHDPPTIRIAGELYSGDFYRELYRVLRRGGRLFHYVGDLESKSGSVTVKGVMRRLKEAGFSRVLRVPEAFGVVAYK